MTETNGYLIILYPYPKLIKYSENLHIKNVVPVATII